MLYPSLVISTASTPISSLLWRGKKTTRQAPHLINNSNEGIITSFFHKKTYTGLLTNYYSFVPFSYKLGLVRTLVDRIYLKLITLGLVFTWTKGKTLNRNLFPSSEIENVVRKFLNSYFIPESSLSISRKENCLHVKLAYIGPFS